MSGKRRTGLWIGLMAGLIGLGGTAAWAQDAASNGGYTSALDQFFTSGGIIVWFVQFPMSIVMVALAVHYVIGIRRSTLLPEEVHQQIQGLLEQRQYREALEFTATEPSMLSGAMHAALSAAGGGFAAMQRSLDDSVDERVGKLLRKIEIMNIIGNIAPMIGLFGTIYGMILAFNQLVLAGGSPDPAKLAGAISTALVTTFWGLLTAIPALSVFAFFRNRIDGLAAECAVVAEDLLGMIQPSKPGPAPAPKTEPAAAKSGIRPPVAQRLDDRTSGGQG